MSGHYASVQPPHSSFYTSPALAILFIFFVLPAPARVSGPWLEGNQRPDEYQVDGYTIDGILNQIITPSMTDREKVISIWKYLMVHIYHTRSLYEPTNRAGDHNDVHDAVKRLHTYGAGICGESAPTYCAFLEQAGFEARCRNIGSHTVPEVFYGGAWHYIDHDLAGYAVKGDGTIASVDEVAANPNLLDNAAPPEDPHYPWKTDNAHGYWDTTWGMYMYQTWATGHSMNFTLRAGEIFTRYFQRQWGPDYQWWGNDISGFSGGDMGIRLSYDGTFVTMSNPPPTGSSQYITRSQFNTSQRSPSNGEYIYTPSFDDDSYLEGVTLSNNVSRQGVSPKLHATAAGAKIVFYMRTPYVICAFPSDGDDPATAGATRGAVVSGQASGSVTLEVSNDMGVTWQDYGSVSGSFSVDFTDKVKGRYQYWVRFVFGQGAGLDSLTFDTRVQLAPAQLPGLETGVNNMSYRRSNLSVLEFTPDIWTSQASYEALRYADDNILWKDDSIHHLAMVNRHNPASVTYRLTASGRIRKINASVWLLHPNPPGDPTYTLSISTDGGATWTPFASKQPFSETWGTWMNGSTDVTDNVTECLVKAEIDTGTNPGWEGLFGFKQFRYYVYYDDATDGDLIITHCWEENSIEQTHTETITAGTSNYSYTINCAAQPDNKYIRFEVPAEPPIPNTPPVVDAGTDTNVTLPAATNLDGTVSDDGLPNPPGTVTSTWSKDSGPGTVTFGNGGTVDTTAIFSTAGTYVLRLTADDGALQAFDTVTITVNAAADTDGDGMPDWWETQQSLNPNSGADASSDPDNDGLTNLQEYQNSTAAQNPDTDGDGISDGDEVAAGTDPNNSNDPGKSKTTTGCRLAGQHGDDYGLSIALAAALCLGFLSVRCETPRHYHSCFK